MKTINWFGLFCAHDLLENINQVQSILLIYFVSLHSN